MEETWVGFLGWEEALEENTANHFNIPAGNTWTEEPSGLWVHGI